MSKKWLIPAIAGFALMVSACGNNAAPNYTNPNNTTNTQRAGMGYGADGMNTRNYGVHNYGVGRNGAGYNGTGFDGMHGTTYGNRHGAGTFGGMRDGFGFRHTDGVRGDGTRPFGTNGLRRDGYRGFGADGMAGNDGRFGWTAPGNGGYGTAGIGLGHDFNVNNYNNGARPYAAFPDGRTGMGTTGTGGMTGTTGTTGTTGMTGTTGTTGHTGTHSIYQSNTHNRRGMGTMQTGMTRLGYSQTNSNQIRTNGLDHVYVDRDALARAVSNVTASCPGVERSTVLVTDEEILVGLNTTGQEANTAKKQARQNAMSIAPRYYKVHVTTDPNIVQELTTTASRSSNVSSAGHHEMNVAPLIKRMGGKTEREEARTHRTAGQHTKTSGR